MQVIRRRDFFTHSTATVAAAGVTLSWARELVADPLGLPIGCQVFPIREQLAADFEGTLRKIAAIGYRVIEFCSPPSFVNMGFASFVGMKASEIREKIEQAGLRVVSCHYQFSELKQHLEERIEFAAKLGLKQMVVATLAIKPSATLDEWRRAADEMNTLGEGCRKAGIQLGFHNHGFEFQRLGDVPIFDVLMRQFEPELVKSQFQVGNVLALGFDPASYLEKYHGRFLSLHLQDWSAKTRQDVPVGQGDIDWKKLFLAARLSHIEHYFVEMNMLAMIASYNYLHGLSV